MENTGCNTLNSLVGDKCCCKRIDTEMALKCFKRIFHHLVLILFYTLLFCAFDFSIIPGAEGGEVVDRIVAIVNDDIITLFELNRSIQPYTEKIRGFGYPSVKESQMLFKVREEILNKLIDEKIKDQEIKRFHITVDQKEIDQTIERIKEVNYYTDEELRAALSSEGLTMEEYRERVKEQMLRSKLVNREIKSKIVITKEDIKSYYDSRSEKYGGEKKYHLLNIIMQVSPLADEAEKQQIKNKMEMVLEKLKDGEPFENMVVTYSESPLASKGGDLGFFSLDQLSPNLREAIKGLAAGDLTPVMDTDQGYQIFLVQEVIQTAAKSLDEVAPEIENILFNEIVNTRFQSWFEELRKRSHIQVIQ